VVGSQAHREVERRAAQAAVVLVQNRDEAVPLRLEPDDRILVLSATDPEGFARMAAGRGIGPNVVERSSQVAFQEIKRRHANTDELTVHPEHLEAALPPMEKAAAIVVVTEKYPLAGLDFPDESQHRLIQMLTRERRAPVIVLACRDPYELARIPEVDAYVCAVGYRPACVAAGVGVVFGETRAQGRLPVAVPGLYPVGWRNDG
jgi:beta-N-acetylhexosaminidase